MTNLRVFLLGAAVGFGLMSPAARPVRNGAPRPGVTGGHELETEGILTCM
jgi:hypothetical protein